MFMRDTVSARHTSGLGAICFLGLLSQVRCKSNLEWTKVEHESAKENRDTAIRLG